MSHIAIVGTSDQVNVAATILLERGIGSVPTIQSYPQSLHAFIVAPSFPQNAFSSLTMLAAANKVDLVIARLWPSTELVRGAMAMGPLAAGTVSINQAWDNFSFILVLTHHPSAVEWGTLSADEITTLRPLATLILERILSSGTLVLFLSKSLYNKTGGGKVKETHAAIAKSPEEEFVLAGETRCAEYKTAVIIRAPPIVYGRDFPGKLQTLLREAATTRVVQCKGSRIVDTIAIDDLIEFSIALGITQIDERMRGDPVPCVIHVANKRDRIDLYNIATECKNIYFNAIVFSYLPDTIQSFELDCTLAERYNLSAWCRFRVSYLIQGLKRWMV